jgi:hypothetical protein
VFALSCGGRDLGNSQAVAASRAAARAQNAAKQEDRLALYDFCRSRREAPDSVEATYGGCDGLGVHEVPTSGGRFEPDGFHATALRPRVADVCTHFLSEASLGLLNKLREEWEKRHYRIDHDQCPQISPEMPVATTTRCRSAGFCVCSQLRLCQFVKSLKSLMRKFVAKGKLLRPTLDMGMLILSLRTPVCEPLFWHISFRT